MNEYLYYKYKSVHDFNYYYTYKSRLQHSSHVWLPESVGQLYFDKNFYCLFYLQNKHVRRTAPRYRGAAARLRG